MLRRIILIAFAGCLFSYGCTTTAHYSLPAGKSNEEFQRRLAYCRMQSQMRPTDPNENGFMQLAMMQAFIDNCLRAEGYARTD